MESMQLYKEFFKTCRNFDQFVQEQKWSIVTNRAEFKSIIESEFLFWKRVISLVPPERNVLKEFEWFQQCYLQIMKNLKDETSNWKMRWLQDDD